MIKSLLYLLRPHQWIKNVFVLVGTMFGHQWTGSALIDAALLFAGFCAGASSVYIVNDILDVEADRRHPKKCKRPIASGAISVSAAAAVAAGLLIAAAALTLKVSTHAVAFLLAYWVLHLGYSMYFKHVAVLDVFVIAAGFMLRLLAGTIGIGILISNWLLLCGMMVTLFLGFAKRRAELLLVESQNGAEKKAHTRSVLKQYSPDLLDHCLSVCAAGTIIGYGLYTMNPDTIALHKTDRLIYTLPFVVYGIFRYIYLLHDNDPDNQFHGSDTARDLLQDKHLLLTVVGWLALTLWLLAEPHIG